MSKNVIKKQCNFYTTEIYHIIEDISIAYLNQLGLILYLCMIFIITMDQAMYKCLNLFININLLKQGC